MRKGLERQAEVGGLVVVQANVLDRTQRGEGRSRARGEVELRSEGWSSDGVNEGVALDLLSEAEDEEDSGNVNL